MQDVEIDEWFHAYLDDIHNYLVYFTNSQDVEDLVQETFIKAVKGIKSFKGDSQPKTWLLSIARNIAIDHYRRKPNVKFLPAELMENVPTSQVQPDTAAEIRETHETILSAISEMKMDYREVLLYRVVVGLSISETSDILGWSQSKVRTTLHRALKQLRKSLGNVTEGGLTYDSI